MGIGIGSAFKRFHRQAAGQVLGDVGQAIKDTTGSTAILDNQERILDRVEAGNRIAIPVGIAAVATFFTAGAAAPALAAAIGAGVKSTQTEVERAHAASDLGQATAELGRATEIQHQVDELNAANIAAQAELNRVTASLANPSSVSPITRARVVNSPFLPDLDAFAFLVLHALGII